MKSNDVFQKAEEIYDILEKSIGFRYTSFATKESLGVDPSLNNHVSRMLHAYKTYVEKNLANNGYKFKTLSKNAIIFHDIGKLNPFFQYRMIIKSHPDLGGVNFNKEWSYHSLSSAIIAYASLVGEDIDVACIVGNAILSHHSSILVLLNSITQVIRLKEDLKHRDSTIAACIKITIDHICNLSDIVEILPSKYLKKLNRLKNVENTKFNNFLKSVVDALSKQASHLTQDSHNFIKIAHCSSVLSNLDTWEAKTGRTQDMFVKKIPFDIDRSGFHGDQEMITNFLELRPNRDAPLFPYRVQFQDAIMDSLQVLEYGKIYTITAPTGIGKTMGIMRVAMQIWNKYVEDDVSPQVIYALPFLSICDQIEERLFHLFNLQESQNDMLAVHHSMATFGNKKDDTNTTDQEFIDEDRHSIYEVVNWRARFVVTTTVCLFNTLLRYFKKDLVRFHRVSNAIIIIDEYHSISVEYYKLLREFLPLLCEMMNCTFILATATTPVIFKKHGDIIRELPTYGKDKSKSSIDYSEINRYLLDLSQIAMDQEVSQDEFPKFVISTLAEKKPENALVVVNTRKLAHEMYNALLAESEDIGGPLGGYSIEHLSSNITPADRRDRISAIIQMLEKNERFILVTTQLIEAGVDVSFNFLARQFAPLHAIIQCAGRVNRSGKMDNLATVLVVNCPTKGPIYHATDLACTRAFLKKLVKLDGTDRASKYHIAESTIRAHFPDYAKELQSFRKVSRAVNEFSKFDFPGLCKEFTIIENNVPITVFVKKFGPAELEKLINSVQKRRQVPSKFYAYAIALYKNKEWDTFKEHHLSKGLYEIKIDNKENDNELEFYFLDLSYPEGKILYNTKIGLRPF